MWLSDLHPKRIQNARWFMFNYDSVIKDGTDIFSVGGLTQVAELLLKELSFLRLKPKASLLFSL